MKKISMSTLILSTIMIIGSNNWMSLWLGLEINMMSFIVYMKEKNNKSTQAMMTYFLIQSMSSAMFLFSIMMQTKMNYNLIEMILSSALIMKIGAAPMHMWFINMNKMITWNQILMLATWQKIAPLYILSKTVNSMMITLTSMMSIIMGAIGGINQTSMKKVMAFSSVNHLGWMMICMKYDKEMWIKYLALYTIIILMIIYILKKKSIEHLNQMNLNLTSKTEKIIVMIMFLSLAGMPPFTGFLMKWIVIQCLMENSMNFMMMLMIMMSMITTFYYLRMMTPIIMMNNINNKWKKMKKSKSYYMMIMYNMFLPMMMIMNMN